MKFRYALILIVTTLLLASCTLAADITPPPGYIPPTPGPTMGPLFPPQAPDVASGAAIYAEKCAPCHGVTGLGDGEKGKQLPVTVAAFALPETAHKASPAQWFTTVTQGKMDRFMPPFASLNDQQRWDVVSYAMTLHTTPQQIEMGKSLYQKNKCAECHAEGYTQEKTAGLSPENIAFLIVNGRDKMPATQMTDEEAYAVAAYVRTLTFASLPTPTSTAVPVSPTPIVNAETTGTPSAQVTLDATAQALITPETGAQTEVPTEAAVVAGFGTVSGKAEGAVTLSAGLPVKLHGYDHAADKTSGPQEILTLDGKLNADGSYKFENVEMPEGRIFLVDVEYKGVLYQSDFAPVVAGTPELVLPTIVIYESTTDFKVLQFQQVHLYSDFATEGSVQFLAIYTFTNASDKSVNIATDGTSIPFIVIPDGATDVGYEAGQDSATFMGSADGVAIPPSETPYSIIAYFSLPYDGKKLDVKQNFLVDTASVLALIPEGIKVDGSQLTPGGTQAIQNGNFQTFNASGLKAGDTLAFSVSGKPKTTAASATPKELTKNQTLLIGIGSFGLALILAGVWMFMRDRKRGEVETEEVADEFEDTESVMDAIIALDDLHRAGKIPDEAYHARRAELKEKLKKEI